MSAPGGFVEAQGTTPRTKWTDDEINAAVPGTRSMFIFPAPYNTRAWRVTVSADTGGQDGVWYNGYSYWPKMNYHNGSTTMKILIGLNVDKGGDGANIYSLDKNSNVVTKTGPLFGVGSAWRNVIPEMWYWSLSNQDSLYLVDWHKTASDGDLQRMNVQTGNISTVFDISAKYGDATAIARQCHSSADDVHHAGTVFLGTFSAANTVGAFYYNEQTDTFRVYAKEGVFDECHIDKSGRYTILGESVAGVRQNRVFDNTTGDLVWTIVAGDGALGHFETGYGYMVGVNNQQVTPNSVQTFTFPGMPGPVVHSSYDFSQAIMNHISHVNAKDGNPMSEQIIYGSNADNTSYQNELTCCTLIESGLQLVVAPIMTDVTTGGGGDDYGRRPKGSVDVTGKYFLWTTNLGGSSRLDAFLVEVPTQLLVPEPGSVGRGLKQRTLMNARVRVT